MNPPLLELDAEVLKLVQAAGAAGYVAQAVEPYTIGQVRCCLERLVRTGRSFKGKIGHRTMRIFASKTHAQRYAGSRKTIGAVTAARDKRASARALWGPDTPVTYHPDFKHTVAAPSVAPALRTNTHLE